MKILNNLKEVFTEKSTVTKESTDPILNKLLRTKNLTVGKVVLEYEDIFVLTPIMIKQITQLNIILVRNIPINKPKLDLVMLKDHYDMIYQRIAILTEKEGEWGLIQLYTLADLYQTLIGLRTLIPKEDIITQQKIESIMEMIIISLIKDVPFASDYLKEKHIKDIIEQEDVPVELMEKLITSNLTNYFLTKDQQ